MKEQLAGLIMGGRVAERKLFQFTKQRVLQMTLNKATQMARAMVTEYGIGEKLGPGPIWREIMQCLVLKAHKNDFRTEQAAKLMKVRSLLNEANIMAEIIQNKKRIN